MKIRHYFIVLALVFLSPEIGQAQDSNQPSCPCCTEAHSAFDFWLGEWTVYSEDAKVLGKNTISKNETYANCLVMEAWEGTGISRGTSYNYYNRTDKTWNQVWVDNSGFSLTLKGNRVGNSMVLKSELLTGQKGKYYNQITWQLNEDQSVTQTWELFDEAGKLIQQAFKGIYKKTVK